MQLGPTHTFFTSTKASHCTTCDYYHLVSIGVYMTLCRPTSLVKELSSQLPVCVKGSLSSIAREFCCIRYLLYCCWLQALQCIGLSIIISYEGTKSELGMFDADFVLILRLL